MESLNYRPNSKLIDVKILLLAVFFAAGNFFSCAHAAELDETIRILERWTSAHWGQDCFVWVVHYPDEIISAWVDAEASRAGMSETQRENFRKDFVSRLRLETSETFLVSVYSFGSRPVNLSPVRENISLLAASGERIRPSDYDSALDYPAGGVVQGLVFFPKQSNKDYVIALKGMGRNERVFSFAPPEVPAPPKQEKKSEVVVVNLPKKQPKKQPEQKVVEAPPPPPIIPPRPVPPLFHDDSKDMAAFVEAVQNRQKETPPQVQTPRPALNSSSNSENSYVSRESVLRRFLMYFANNQPNEMYDMLSDFSRKQISRENFAKEVARASDFREGLKADFRIDWIGEERAKVITTHKTLVFKSVSSRTFGITREGSSWRVVW